ncbi:hypothetical protein HMPREF1012_03883 [Bacillus sp. BT1B_CT2]|uniref:hypothetical protein n=1 Tax=Bacillus TaxID=1386 RepID=UPI0001F45792|nr:MULTISPECIES: hypothetical protein [Bacillus]KJD55529.1 hypothetical protein UZ38_21790 [Bacillus amyloliquefaciens]KUL08157.1 hypothetical protein LI7559_15890 [Bacillus licheniformis LMG 7559]AGN35069.1 hypothetical protein BaLi_c06730 [Bacillus paralicheniformis ATCC 9945a]EFV70095.1 hypothetical protein HMPREF1012_03883 [Bacillus sp. BT1B_CT2]MBW7636496.1 hypothetical protein [Bacillus licheniformis]
MDRETMKNFQLPDYLTEKQKEEIIHAINTNKPILISGNQGPTGKTTLKNYLVEHGILAFEKWECCEIELNRTLEGR